MEGAEGGGFGAGGRFAGEGGARGSKGEGGEGERENGKTGLGFFFYRKMPNKMCLN